MVESWALIFHSEHADFLVLHPEVRGSRSQKSEERYHLTQDHSPSWYQVKRRRYPVDGKVEMGAYCYVSVTVAAVSLYKSNVHYLCFWAVPK